MTALLSAAFAAGMVSTVNPCGFAMLPAYLGYFLGEGRGRNRRHVGLVAGAVSSGFLVVFTAAGLLVGVGVRAVVTAIPWLALAVGIGLVVVGVAQLRGTRLLPYLPGPGRARQDLSLRGMFVFGVSYAVASLSCTLPIFLSLVGGVVAARTLPEAMLAFGAYGLGMATVVTGITAFVAVGRRSVIERVRPLARRMDAIAGWTMTIAGSFIVWYWATVLTGGAVALGANRAVRWIDQVSAWVTGIVGRNAVAVAVGLLALIAVAYLSDRHRRLAAHPDEDHRTATSVRSTGPDSG